MECEEEMSRADKSKKNGGMRKGTQNRKDEEKSRTYKNKRIGEASNIEVARGTEIDQYICARS